MSRQRRLAVTAAVELSGLTKSFGAVRAVNDVNAVIAAGQVTAFLGPNGAGKTTTLRMLLGLVAPTSGTATFDGRRYDELPDPVRHVGAVLEASGYHPGRTALDHLRVLATAARLGKEAPMRVLADTGLAEDARRRVGEFSLGMRQRLGLAAAMLGDPAVLVLDEPTNGLDPQGVRWLRGYVRQLADEGRTVLVSSHALNEVEQTADHVLLIAEGPARPVIDPRRPARRGPRRLPRPHTGTGAAVHRARRRRPPPPARRRRTRCRRRPRAGRRARRGARGRAAPPHRDGPARGGLLPPHRTTRAGRGPAVARGGAGMNALVRAELLKLRSTRMPAWLLLATLAMAVLTVAFSIPSADAKNNALSLDEPALLARIIGVSFGVPQVTMVLLGVLAFTQEVRYGTITSTFLIEPRRPRVLAAKGVALVLAGVVIAAATLVVALIASVAFIHRQHGNVTFGAELWQVVAAVFVVMALYGVIGVAVGALLRDQIVAVVVALIWLTAVEHLLIEALPRVARWTPGGATYGLLQLGPAVTTRATLLAAPTGGLLLVGYTAAAVALALVIAPRRDVQ